MPTVLFCIGIGLLLGFEEAGAFFLPGDISLLAAGVRARGEEGPLLLLALWGVSALSMVIGATSLYHTVRISDRFDRVLPRRARSMIQRHGVWGVAVARILPGLRNATVFAAASSNLPYRRFLMGLVPAALVWSGVMLLAGWFGGAAMLAAFGRLHESHALRFVSVTLIACAALFVAWRMLSGARKTKRARRDDHTAAIQDGVA
ncbi:MAG: hypothetical protein PVSMB7_05250 [Chloroflexota bacterium]